MTATPVASRQRRLDLPAWKYGRNSAADDTVLMFRGNGAHTFYGTGPIPDAPPRMLWRFKTAVKRNRLRGRRVTWAGTGWTGTAIKLPIPNDKRFLQARIPSQAAVISKTGLELSNGAELNINQ